MREYYEAEMRRLLESAGEFSRLYPEQASQLNIDDVNDRDPYIERLLEGTAYLTAQVKKKIDDDIPEISEALLQHLWPDFLNPFPSATIMQITHRPGQLRTPLRVSRGTGIESQAVGPESTRCRFTTGYDIDVLPFTIKSTTVDETDKGDTVLDIVIGVEAGTHINTLAIDKLTFYLHAERPIQYWLFNALTRYAQTIHVQVGPDVSCYDRIGGQECITPSGRVFSNSLNDCSDRNFIGYHYLQEYFCFRDKFFYVDIANLDCLTTQEEYEEFTLRITLDAPLPDNHAIDRDTFRLNCVPAVNVYRHSSEPVYVTQKQYEYPVVADIMRKESVKNFSIVKVEAQNVDTGERVSLQDMASCEGHLSDSDIYYERSAASSSPSNYDTYITISGSNTLSTMILSCDMQVNNHQYPRKYLKEGSIRFPMSDFSSNLMISNITRPSRFRSPPDKSLYRWHLVTHLARNYSGLFQLDSLKSLLETYDWSNDRSNAMRINGLRDVEVQSCTRMIRGCILHGTIVKVTVNDAAFALDGDMYLFGMVLHRFMDLYTDINRFINLEIVGYPSATGFEYSNLDDRVHTL